MCNYSIKKKENTFKVFFMAYLVLIILMNASCNSDTSVSSISFKFPEVGKSFSLGQDVLVELDGPNVGGLTSVTYLLDGKPIETKNNSEHIILRTSGLAIGPKIISAIIEYNGQKDTLATNIIMNSGFQPKEFTYEIVKKYPHDTSSYIQGLEYHNAKFLESTGLNGQSTLRWVNIATGKALKRIDLDKQYFGEGSTLVGDNIVMLTYKTNMGFVFDANTFEQKRTFKYQTYREGWGLCFDGKHLIMSDGSNRLYFMNKDTYKDDHTIDVYDNQGIVNLINELEYIDGKLYANIYTKNYIVVINPITGVVEQKIDFSGLLPLGYFTNAEDASENVLNGIAWDKKGKRLFVTGKKWPQIFEVKLVTR